MSSRGRQAHRSRYGHSAPGLLIASLIGVRQQATRRQDKGREERALDELICRENWKDLAKFAFRERVAPKKKHQLTGATRGHTIGRLCRPLESWNYLLKWKI